MAKRTTGLVKPASSIFGEVAGEQFGGSANYAKFTEGEVVHGFKHVEIEKDVILSAGNKPIDLHVAIDPRNGEKLRMPAPAVFCQNIAKAKLKPGDEYSVARLADTVKKTGSKAQGKGNKMEVYAILVTKRK